MEYVRVLTQEERDTLKEISSDHLIREIGYYMKHKVGNSESNIKNVTKTLRQLLNGNGITHQKSRKHGHIFKEGIYLTLIDDISKLLQEEADWIDDHGTDVSNGWLIRHPLKKLLRYQIARIDKGEDFFPH